MAFISWLTNQVPSLADIVAIVSLLFAGIALRAHTKETRIQTLFAVTAAHREIWKMALERPELERILRVDIDPGEARASLQEHLFIQFLILHLYASFEARKTRTEFNGDAIAEDIRQFFARPIPRSVWERSRAYQSREFVAFVERAMAE